MRSPSPWSFRNTPVTDPTPVNGLLRPIPSDKVTTDLALDHHKSGDAPEPTLVTERPCERLRLVQVFSHARPIA
jgi:hypothetical protein